MPEPEGNVFDWGEAILLWRRRLNGLLRRIRSETEQLPRQSRLEPEHGGQQGHSEAHLETDLKLFGIIIIF